MRLARMFIVIALCAVVGYGIREYWAYRELHPSTDDAYVQAHIVDIAARVTGPVVAVHVAENDHVEAGQLLFEVDPSTFEANVAAARANYDLALQATGASGAEVSVARSTLEERQVSLARAVRNLERATALSASNLIPEAEFDDATATVAEARAAVASARADLLRAENEFGVQGEENSRLRAAAAALRTAELELSFSRIVAPVSGWVSNLTLRDGAMVIAERPQFSIVDDHEWWVEANFKETDLNAMQPGQRARITIDMYPGLELHGAVESLGAGSGAVFSLLPPENATGNWVKVTQRFPVRVGLAPRHDDPRNLRPLRVGASATVTVDVEP